MTAHEQSKTETPSQIGEGWFAAVREQVNSLRFGVVQIVVHNGRVVQIEKTEKIRFDQTNEREPKN